MKERNEDMQRKTTLKELISISKDGEWGSDKDFEDSIRMRVIRGTDFANVRRGDLSTVPIRHIAKRYAKIKTLKPADIIIETAGGSPATNRSTGRTLFLGELRFEESSIPMVCASFSRYIRIDSEKANPNYVFWLLQYLYKKEVLRKYHTQHTGVARFQWTVFSRNELLILPPRSVQDSIAKILSCFDNLIEISFKQIRTLKTLARSIFKEWFVDFHFPNNENEKIQQTTYGPEPEGWDYQPIGKVLTTIGGGTPSTAKDEFWKGGDINWYTPSDLTANDSMFITESSRKITEEGLKKSSAVLFAPYSVMMTSRATVGVLSINSQKACTNQGFIVVVPNDQLPVFYLYFWLDYNMEKIKGLASGATFKELRRTTFREISILIPENRILHEYLRLISPICHLIEILQRKMTILEETRETLLSKLISDANYLPKLENHHEGGR